MERKSPYDMIAVSTAIKLCLENTNPLPCTMVRLVDCCGCVLAEDVVAADPFPAFACSTMDGYAVLAPLEPGVYDVIARVLAGSAVTGAVSQGAVAYITTGAKIPPGANAVIQVEATEAVDSSSSEEKSVRILQGVEVGSNIRPIGCDIAQGELVLRKGQVLRPAEVGLLATVGVSQVPVYTKPVIGVMSTGNELVEVEEVPQGSQIRDSNRVSLLSAFRADGLSCVDLGIVRDVRSDLEAALLFAAQQCDVVVTSGGVSMGEADFVKPLLQRLGTVHFGRLNMKPGKPTTFATLRGTEGRQTLFFGLPGNPVSCLVTKALLIDPTLRRIQGADSAQCMHAQARVRISSSLRLDPERPEYHRAIVSVDESSGELVAVSTGSQASSRLLSLCSCNALLCLPRRGASGDLPVGTVVTALLTGAVAPPPPRACAHQQAAMLDHPLLPSTPPTPQVETVRMRMRIGVLTVSDRAFNGTYADESGPEIERNLTSFGALPFKEWPVESVIAARAVVPDEMAAIQAKIMEWVDGGMVDVLLTTGGTGFGARDLTPEAIAPLLDRHAPALAQALVSEGLRHTPLACLSRPVAGTRGRTFVCTFPGSVKGVRENIVALQRLLPRILELLLEGQCKH